MTRVRDVGAEVNAMQRHFVARVRTRALRFIAGRDAVLSYAQEGEDRILLRIFEERQANGFYIDVGAHHPTRFSNTHLLHLAGWRGINIDAMPGSMQAFERARPNDINLEMGVAATAGSLRYYVFNEPALNTFSAEVAATHEANAKFRVIQTVDLPVLPLAEILRQHAPAGAEVDLLSVDVEGLDLDVLRSHDWDAFPPTVVCVEAWKDGAAESTDDFLRPLGYEPVARTQNSRLYQQLARS